MNFIQIQDGSFSINTAQIASIEWFPADEEDGIAAYANVTLSNGETFTFESEDYDAIKEIAGA